MRLTDEEIKNKFSALDFDKQNARQNRIYSKLSFKTDDRRYAMKKFIYALGSVCIIGVLLIPVFKREKKIEQPEIKQPVTTVAEKPEITKEEIKTPAFVKVEGEKVLPTTSGLEETDRNPFLAQDVIDMARREAERMRKAGLESARPAAMASMDLDGAAYDGAAMANFSTKSRSAGLAASAGGAYPRSMRMMPPPPDYRRHYSYSADYDSMNAESFKSFEGNTFKFVSQEPLSTFSADVDTASYNIVRRDIERGKLPNKDAVRTEEFINYFTYNYPAPKSSSKDPVNIITELTDSPWTEDLQVVKIGVKAKDIDKDKLPASNLVFLVDVSGSMSGQNRLPLAQKAFAMLVEKLRPQDKVSIVTYANGTSVVLDGASLKEEGGKQRIISAMEGLRASGGTNGSEGLKRAYEVAKKNFIKGGNNRIILATDGDFNIGNTSLGGLEKQITDAKESGVFLSVLGFGMGNYKDDRVQTLANKGNGNYAYINDLFEAKKALVKDFGATLFTVAKDVKFQVEFNPAKVQAYRLIGYEKRKLNDQDFNDDTKDAGELGAGHTVTVIYEIVPAGVKMPDGMAGIDELKYSAKAKPQAVDSDEMLTVKLRYKEPDGDKSKLMSKVLKAKDYLAFDKTSDDTRFALTAAAFAELLKGGRYSQETDIDKLIKEARKAKGEDEDGYRADFVKLMSLYEALPKEKEEKYTHTVPVVTRYTPDPVFTSSVNEKVEYLKKAAKAVKEVVAFEEEYYQEHGHYTSSFNKQVDMSGIRLLDYSNGRYVYAITKDGTNSIVWAYRYTNSTNYDKLTCQALQNNQNAIDACKKFLGNEKFMRAAGGCVIGPCEEYQKI